MANNEEGKSFKTQKSSSPATPDQANQTNQTNIHVYPDWAAMQAYYGPRVTLPPYYNSTVASGHAPHPYMWGPPQHMMPPYGAPYAAIYPHGGVYAHAAVPLGSHAHGQGVPLSPATVTPLSIETPTKSGNADRGLLKKLKEFDGLAMSIGNGTAESAECGAEHRLSQSTETEGSSGGSDGNTAKANQTKRKRSREGTPTTGNDGMIKTKASPVSAKEINAAPDKVLGAATVTTASVPGNMAGSGVSSGITALELRNTSNGSTKTTTTAVPQSCTIMPPEGWLQNEREQKRERRKQSNRESARRSRLRKQAEADELARKVDSLIGENAAIKSEIDRLSGNSQKLRLENNTLMEKLKNAQLGQKEEISLNSIDEKRALPVSTENLLSRVNNSASADRNPEEKSDMYEKSSNSGAKLHQLLDTSPRADAVAAG